MRKVRTFGFAFAAVAGIVMAGSGTAFAEGETTPVDTGSAAVLPALVEALSTGSAGAGGGEPANTSEGETPVDTGSASLAPTLAELLATGSAGAGTGAEGQ